MAAETKNLLDSPGSPTTGSAAVRLTADAAGQLGQSEVDSRLKSLGIDGMYVDDPTIAEFQKLKLLAGGSLLAPAGNTV